MAFAVIELKPIQMPYMDMPALFAARRAFTDEQWIDALIRSTGMEASCFKQRVKWHFLARMEPLVELQNNGVPGALTLATFIALCSAALSKPVQSQLAVLGDMSLGGTIVQGRNLAECMQVAFDAVFKALGSSSVRVVAASPVAKYSSGALHGCNAETTRAVKRHSP